MIISKQRLDALEKRIATLESSLEKITKSLDFEHKDKQNTKNPENLSYKEVLDQWLNGKAT
jgi:BMFP domain-containing protein YqiC